MGCEFTIQHADHMLHIKPTDSFRCINPTQILLIFESMQYCRNKLPRTGESLFKHFFIFVCFHATYISNLDTWYFVHVVIQGDHV